MLAEFDAAAVVAVVLLAPGLLMVVGIVAYLAFKRRR